MMERLAISQYKLLFKFRSEVEMGERSGREHKSKHETGREWKKNKRGQQKL